VACDVVWGKRSTTKRRKREEIPTHRNSPKENMDARAVAYQGLPEKRGKMKNTTRPDENALPTTEEEIWEAKRICNRKIKGRMNVFGLGNVGGIRRSMPGTAIKLVVQKKREFRIKEGKGIRTS